MQSFKKPADRMLVGLLFFLAVFSACEETQQPPEYLYVIASVLNLREQPTTQARVVKRLERGQELIILKRDDAWVQVQADEKTRGWVHGDYVGDPSAVRTALQKELVHRSPAPRPRPVQPPAPASESKAPPVFSIDAMLSGMPDDMVLEEIDPIEGQQRFMGAAAGGQVVVSFWGSEHEVQRADIMVSVVDVPEDDLQRNAACVLQFVQNAVPHWQRDTAWVANFLKELSSKDKGEGGFDTREKIVRFQFVKPLRAIRVTIEKV